MQIRFSFLSMTTSARKTLKTLEALYVFLRWKQMIHFLADWVEQLTLEIRFAEAFQTLQRSRSEMQQEQAQV